MLEILKVENGRNLEQVRILWFEFAELLKSRLHEVTHHLPGRFGPPAGCMLLAEYNSETAGCVGLMDLGDDICEMRRLFVRPQFRRLGIGNALAEAVIERGRSLRYAAMRLNTNKKMTGAVELYRSLGFRDIEPYEQFDIDCMYFLELKLG